MISNSKGYVEGVTEWIDEIEDVDAFLDQLFSVNEESLKTSPSLDTFCMSFSMNTTESLISNRDENEYVDIFKRIEECSFMPTILESRMHIPENIFNLSFFEKDDEDSFKSSMSESLLHVRGLFNEASFSPSQSLTKAA